MAKVQQGGQVSMPPKSRNYRALAFHLRVSDEKMKTSDDIIKRMLSRTLTAQFTMPLLALPTLYISATHRNTMQVSYPIF